MIVNITNVKKDFGKGGGERERHNKTKYLLIRIYFIILKIVNYAPTIFKIIK